MNLRNYLLVFIPVISLFFSCESPRKEADSNQPKIFELLDPQAAGVTFENRLHENDSINYFTYPYIYMGGGVAVGDINNDGLQDLYFTGNMVSNKLYLNKGDMKFEDITEKAGVESDDRWITGVTMADVNADGFLDIYVSVSGVFNTTKNQLFVNNGDMTFSERAEEFGIADDGNSTQGTFFDYDKDGDLDLYVANYPPASFKTQNVTYRFFMDEAINEKSDHLYKNNGDGTFSDVTETAGLTSYGLSLSATVGDFDQNGWPDIYVSNDFATPDYFYFNNGDGTFTDKVRPTTQHIAFYGMGVDVADYNNDGLLDLMQVDMTPEDNRRSKANMASMNPPKFWEGVNLGFHYQYMQNSLQLNNGIGTDSLPHFSDISRLAGVALTDWSWSPLFADLDNDGWKDLVVSNGTRRDINNKDYFKKIDGKTYFGKQEDNKDYLELTYKMPSETIDNYAFKNNGDLSFQTVTKDWGLSFKSYSNGSSYADLDNDGDLDIIINNIDTVIALFENKTVDMGLANYLRFELKGPNNNQFGIGASITLENNDSIQYQEHTLTRGFQSSVEPRIHFGVGQKDAVQKVTVTWPDGKKQVLENVTANQVVTVNYSEANLPETRAKELKETQLFTDITEEIKLNHRHKENDHNDFDMEVLLPHKMSQFGPTIAVADINGDQLEDFFIGGAKDTSGVFFLQNSDGSFSEMVSEMLIADKRSEDMGCEFFDADGDGDLDLYVVSGGNEYKASHPLYQDRLYLNDGKGQFEKAVDALPEMITSGSKVIPADFDKDGDLDLFVGGRQVPKSYPIPAKSYILRNDGGKFTDVTAEIAPDLVAPGMVTTALWIDYDNDDLLDLVITGEWMPITFFKNTGGKFENMTEAYGFEKSTGWWFSLAAGDFDKDGDMDLIAGNNGLNYKYQANENESFDVYAYDYDKNKKLDIVLGYYNDGVQYPVRGRQCSSEQVPAIEYKFRDYNSFADANLSEIYSTQDLEASLHYQVWNFASSYIENRGNGNFEMRKLPNDVQMSAINGMIIEDFNLDGNLDVLTAGNLFVSEVETTRNDASYGKLLLGDGKGNFKAMPYTKSGFFAPYDAKDLAMINTPNGKLILVANNDWKTQVIKLNNQPVASQVTQAF